jgi:hypothetical protein
MYRELLHNTPEENEKEFGGITFEKLQEVCEAHPELAEIFTSLTSHVQAYGEKINRMKELEKEIHANPEAEKEYNELIQTQSEDKDAFVADIRKLNEEMHKRNLSGMLALFIDRSSIFYGRLMFYLAMQMEEKGVEA